jgi:hypothetical protein
MYVYIHTYIHTHTHMYICMYVYNRIDNFSRRLSYSCNIYTFMHSLPCTSAAFFLLRIVYITFDIYMSYVFRRDYLDAIRALRLISRVSSAFLDSCISYIICSPSLSSEPANRGYIYVCVCVCVCMYVCIYVCIHTYIYVYIHSAFTVENMKTRRSLS